MLKKQPYSIRGIKHDKTGHAFIGTQLQDDYTNSSLYFISYLSHGQM